MIRRLTLENDMEVIETAWHWADSAPKWFRESLNIFKEDFDQYLANFPNELHYGIFENDEPIAIVRLIEAYPKYFCIHLSAKRKANFEYLLQSATTLRDYLFSQGTEGFFGWLPTQNKGVAHLYRSLGFSDSGVRCFKGTIHGKTAELVQYVCSKTLFSNA